MADKSVRYTAELKRHMVALRRAGRTAAPLGKEFGPSAWTIGVWIKQVSRDEGEGDGRLTGVEREELTRLRRENGQLKDKRGILAKVAAWLANEKPTTPKRSSGS